MKTREPVRSHFIAIGEPPTDNEELATWLTELVERLNASLLYTIIEPLIELPEKADNGGVYYFSVPVHTYNEHGVIVHTYSAGYYGYHNGWVKLS